MKIQIILEGGLGNQLFQYAFGRSLSLHYDAELFLYKPFIYQHKVKREYQLDLFGIQGTDNLIQTPFFADEYLIPVQEMENLYTRLDKNEEYTFRGYWQNENYFNRYADQIRSDLDLKIVQQPGRLLVQVRRGDYLDNPYHEYCDLDWYRRAISEMEFDQVIFVSDDIPWCRENFDYIKQPKKFIEGNELDNFKAMYSCDRFVISNSSFGWWGAWWTDSKQVICPEIWTPGNPSYDPSRSTWKKLK